MKLFSWTPGIRRNANVWDIIEAFKSEDDLAKITLMEDHRGADKNTGARRLSAENKKREIAALCASYNSGTTDKLQYLKEATRF